MASTYTTLLLLLLAAALAPSTPATLPDARAATSDVTIPALVTTSKGEVNHTYWLQRLYGAQVSPREAACLRNLTVLHAPSGSCAQLFEQGPCRAREWVVLEGPGLRAACRRRPCAPKFGFVADENRCVAMDGACAGQPSRFRYSLSGRGRCQCLGFRVATADGACPIAFSQGSCQPGQIVAPSYSRTLDASRGQCVANPCPEDEVRLETDDGAEAPLCSSLGVLDCSALMVPLLDTLADVYVPLCDDPIRNTIKIPTRPSSCLRDNSGRCVRSLVHSPQPYDWSVEDDDNGNDSITFPKSAASAAAAAGADSLFTR